MINKRSFSLIKKIILIFAGLFVIISLISGGVFLAINKRGDKSSSVNSAISQNSSPAAGGPQNRNDSTGGAQIPKNLPPGVSTVTLRSVNGKPGNASVIAVADGKNFSLVLEATLSDPGAGNNYAAWLAKSSTSADLVMLGKLENNDGKYSISSNKTGDFTAYKLVIVTLQTGDSDKPQARVFEGSL